MLQGLSTIEAERRLREYGYNELESSKPKNVWRIALEVMQEPMFLLLIACGLLYITLGSYKDGIILLSTILIIIYITFYQYRKTEKALESLKQLSSPRALVIRDGIEHRIAGREVVAGDLLLLREGDRVPADARLLEAHSLSLDESLLTGESMPVSKVEVNDTRIFSGTLVVQGSGMAEVSATGKHTEFGKIGASLKSITQEETRLQKEMKTLIRNLFIVGGFFSLGVIAAFYFKTFNFIQSLLNGLASAMAILPEEFPVVLTIFLALGAWRLSKKKVLTRKPSAIETLGSATVLCSDKTGTITKNNMEIALISVPEGLIEKKQFQEQDQNLLPILTVALGACAKDSIDPMEKAIAEAHRSIVNSAPSDQELLREYPLSPQLLAMSRVLQYPYDKKKIVYCKGAPETVLELCRCNAQELAEHQKVIQSMASKGYRVLAVAEALAEDGPLPESQRGFRFRFLGLLGFEDPIRPEIPQAIAECRTAGIKVIMITGDYPETALSIARQIGLENTGEVLTGKELITLNDQELQKKIAHVNICARVVPDQKLRIVNALKANGEIVAMTGDGVNDAPALKSADIGIAMGGKGTDVAREASALVLLDDNFASIISAMRLGRKIFDNLQKAMAYIIAIHIPIIVLTLLPALIPGLPLLLMPLHIVFLELIIDPVCSIAFESEGEERNIMRRPPRPSSERFFGSRKILQSSARGLLLLGVVLGVYLHSLYEGHSSGEIRAIAFSSLIIANIALVLTSLSKTRSFISVLAEKNLAVWAIAFSALILLFIILTVPVMQKTFAFEFPGYTHFISSLIGAGSMLAILELIKYLKNKKAQINKV